MSEVICYYDNLGRIYDLFWLVFDDHCDGYPVTQRQRGKTGRLSWPDQSSQREEMDVVCRD